jgi:hypothetical protein
MLKIDVQVNVDFDKMTNSMEKYAEEALFNTANQTKENWKQSAASGGGSAKKLGSTLGYYQEALQVAQVSSDTVEVFLQAKESRTNYVVTGIEVGTPAFDPLPVLMAGKHAGIWSSYAKKMPGGEKTRENAQKVYGPKLGNIEKPFREIPKFKDSLHPGTSSPEGFSRIAPGSSKFRNNGITARNFREEPKSKIAEEFKKAFNALMMGK